MPRSRRPEIPGSKHLWTYEPAHRAELVKFAVANLGGSVERGSPGWWATAVLTYEQMLRDTEDRAEAESKRVKLLK